MNKKQKSMVTLFVLLMIITIGLVGLKIYSEINNTKDVINGNYYTKTTLKEAEFLGKFTSNPHRAGKSHRIQTYDQFKILESGEIVNIAFGLNGGHTGEKNVTLAIVDYYSNDTNKHIYQKIYVEEVEDYFENVVSNESIEN